VVVAKGSMWRTTCRLRRRRWPVRSHFVFVHQSGVRIEIRARKHIVKMSDTISVEISQAIQSFIKRTSKFLATSENVGKCNMITDTKPTLSDLIRQCWRVCSSMGYIAIIPTLSSVEHLHIHYLSIIFVWSSNLGWGRYTALKVPKMAKNDVVDIMWGSVGQWGPPQYLEKIYR